MSMVNQKIRSSPKGAPGLIDTLSDVEVSWMSLTPGDWRRERIFDEYSSERLGEPSPTVPK
jgi:hypothetical protein